MDPNGSGTRAEKDFKPNDFIGNLLATKRNEQKAESHNKSIIDFKQHFVNYTGEKFERNVRLGT